MGCVEELRIRPSQLSTKLKLKLKLSLTKMKCNSRLLYTINATITGVNCLGNKTVQIDFLCAKSFLRKLKKNLSFFHSTIHIL